MIPADRTYLAEDRAGVYTAGARQRGPAALPIGLAEEYPGGPVRFVIGAASLADVGLAVEPQVGGGELDPNRPLVLVALPSPFPVARFVLRAGYIHLR